jgi:hypothetical protein
MNYLEKSLSQNLTTLCLKIYLALKEEIFSIPLPIASETNGSLTYEKVDRKPISQECIFTQFTMVRNNLAKLSSLSAHM